MNENLYQAPATSISASSYSSDDTLPPAAVESLLRTQVWARLVSVLGTLLILLYLGILIYAYSQMKREGTEAGLAGMPPQLIAFNVIFGFLTIYPLIRLGKYASAISRLRVSHSVADFQDALQHQRLFWRFVGVVVLTFSVLVIVVWIVGQVIAPYRH